MTSATVAVPRSLAEPAPCDDRRVRLVEFLLVGGATVVLLPLAWLYRGVAGLDEAELTVSFVAFYGAYVINDPHFAVTYLLFYRNAKARIFDKTLSFLQRARYVVAGLVVPVALGAWALAALRADSAEAMGWLIQLMFALVGWHYVKQGFGVLMVLSARRGARFTPLERRTVLAHCFAGWAYGWASPADAGGEVVEKGVVYTSLPHPPGLETITQVVFWLTASAVVIVLGHKIRRERRLPPVAPLAGLLITVWLWTVYSTVDPLMVYLIPALHSLQYLYFVWLLRRNEAREAEGPPAFGRPVFVRLALLGGSALGLGWVLFHGAPAFLDEGFVLQSSDGVARSGLGATPHFAAFFAFVNIHHYFMDHVIWRRDEPATRYLRA